MEHLNLQIKFLLFCVTIQIVWAPSRMHKYLYFILEYCLTLSIFVMYALLCMLLLIKISKHMCTHSNFFEILHLPYEQQTHD